MSDFTIGQIFEDTYRPMPPSVTCILSEYMPLVLSGEREIPTWEEIEAQLPELNWENV